MGSWMWVWIFWSTLRFGQQRSSLDYEKETGRGMGKSSSWGEKEWGGAPLRRRKIGLCVKSLCQSSSQCYQSPAALGQGADNPPREFRGGNTSAGLEGGTGSSTRGFVPSMTLHLQRRKPGVCPDCGNWEKNWQVCAERGVVTVNVQKINVFLLPEPLFAALSVCTDLAAPGGACLASRGMGGTHLRVCLCRIEVCCSTGRLMNETCPGKLR